LKRDYILIAYKLDRLARDVYLSECIRRAVIKNGAKIEIVTGCENEDTPENRLVIQILSAFAEYELKVNAARTKAAMLRHQKNGRRMSNLTPYGWTRNPTNPALMIEDETEQRIIAMIIKLKESKLSLRKIADELEKQNIDCRGGKWYHTTIINILRRANAA
jgi:DNA invertase Pin-like site-specific DNA recombinase